MLLNFIKNSILDFSCLYAAWYAKEAVDDFFFKTLNKKSTKKKKKMLYASALSQKGALKRISTIQGYIQGPLRKKQLIALYRK